MAERLPYQRVHSSPPPAASHQGDLVVASPVSPTPSPSERPRPSSREQETVLATPMQAPPPTAASPPEHYYPPQWTYAQPTYRVPQTELGLTPDGSAIFIDHRIYESHSNPNDCLRFTVTIPREKFSIAQINTDELPPADVSCPSLGLVARLFRAHRIHTPNVETMLRFHVSRVPANSPYVRVQNSNVNFDHSLSVDECLSMFRGQAEGPRPGQSQPLSFGQAIQAGWHQGYNRRFTRGEQFVLACWNRCSLKGFVVSFFLTACAAVIVSCIVWIFSNRSSVAV